MRTWDLNTPAARLRQALKDLKVAKNRVAGEWQDEKFRQFDETFLDPVEPKIRGLMLAIAELSEIMSRAEQACGSR